MDKSATTTHEDNHCLGVSVMSSGWAGMSRTVREVDEDKIRGCKEDIDTLLVFAGLFSAIMTAFLIESYQLLMPSDTTTMISLLQQISAQTQSYTVTPGFHNANLSVSAGCVVTDTFEPTQSAIRINVLWFASLIFSVVTASFGILVKQWLREYLAGEYTSPQARLRIRQFRYPGLEHWKVFEIAAVLPLLLQLALGLFLLGLCFFTWSIHPSVGRTSTPIVAGWAFLFIAVTVAPALSSRCPYKTTLLKTSLKSLRRLLRKVPLLRPLYEKPRDKAANLLCTYCPPVTPEWQHTMTTPERNQLLPFEEEDAAMDEKNDTEMLAAVDSILLDDDVLRTTMWDSLQQVVPAPSDAIKFVFQAIERRLQRNVLSSFPTSILDLRQLTKRGWGAIIDITADTVIRNLEGSPGSPLQNWVEEALIILLSFSDFPLTPNGNRALSLCMSQKTRMYTSRIIASHTPDYKSFTHVLRRLRTVFTSYPPANTALCLREVVRSRIASEGSYIELWDIIRTRRDLPEDVTHVILLILSDILNNKLLKPQGQAWTLDEVHTLRNLLSSPVPVCARQSINMTLSTLLQRIGYTFVSMLRVAALRLEDRAFEESASFCNFQFAYIDSDLLQRRRILQNQRIILETYSKGVYDTRKDLPPISPVRLCRFYLRILSAAQMNDSLDVELRSHWQGIWNNTAKAINCLKLKKYDVEEHKRLAEECLIWLDELDAGRPLKLDVVGGDEGMQSKVDYAEWMNGFSGNSMFPDDLFNALSTFVLDGVVRDRTFAPSDSQKSG